MTCTQECYRMITGAFCTIFQNILTRKTRKASERVWGLHVHSYAANFALSILLVLLFTGGIDCNPGPSDDQNTNGKEGDSTSAANDGNHKDCGNTISSPAVDQLFAAINQLVQAVNRLDTAQASLSTQQTHNKHTTNTHTRQTHNKHTTNTTQRPFNSGWQKWRRN